MTVLEQVLAILEEATQAEPGAVTPETPLSSLDGWDSMGVVFFLGEVSVHWPDVALGADEIGACVTVADLARLVRRAT